MNVATAGSGEAHVLISMTQRKLQYGYSEVLLISVGLMMIVKAEKHIIHSIPSLPAARCL